MSLPSYRCSTSRNEFTIFSPSGKIIFFFVKHTYFRRMANGKLKRKELSLPTDILKKLQTLANKDMRPLKKYMEKVLIDHAKGKDETVSPTIH